MPAAFGITAILTYFTGCLVYSHVKCWLTEPGFPERVSTATSKIAFSKNKMDRMSDNLRSLLSKRNNGFVALLNSN